MSPFSASPLPPGAAGRMRILGIACGALVTAIGVIALTGWILGDDSLKALYAGGITIKTNTALCLICAGLSLMLLAPVRRSAARTVIGRALAVFVMVVGLATLSEHLVGWNLGIDELLFREVAGAPATQSPNRMGPPASMIFPTLGLALLMLDRRNRRGGVPSQWLAFLAVELAMIPIMGYLLGAGQLYRTARFTGIALHSAIGLVLLAIGVLLARAETGPMRLLFTRGSGGLLLRRMLPAAILVPILLSRLRLLGQDAGLYDADFGRSISMLSLITVFAVITWWTASVVERLSSAQRRAEAAEIEMKDQLLRSLESERSARAMAERSNQMKDEFLATLSHELRTPLSAILGWAQVLVIRGSSDPESKNGLEAIERNAKLQAQLIEDLLDMSRIESGKVRLEMQQVDLALVIESVLATAAPLAQVKNLEVQRAFDPWVLPVNGDPARLHQVLWNLVANAIKFTSNDGRIVISLSNVGHDVELAVRDNGVGIAPEFLGQVFDRFRQADASTTRRHGGLGLGLSIAQQLTELHGGSLRAESPGRGQGAIFTIVLPRPTPALLDQAGRRTPSSDGTEHTVPSLGGVRVLVVDDQPDACELVERILRDHGAEVVTASGADAALELLERDVFAVLISDIGMPERDGYDLIRDVRARGVMLPAVALTAFARSEDEQQVLDAGYQRHLTKPVQANQLVREVASLLATDLLVR